MSNTHRIGGYMSKEFELNL